VNLSDDMLFSLSSWRARYIDDLSMFLVLFDTFLSYVIPKATKFFRALCSSYLKSSIMFWYSSFVTLMQLKTSKAILKSSFLLRSVLVFIIFLAWFTSSVLAVCLPSSVTPVAKQSYNSPISLKFFSWYFDQSLCSTSKCSLSFYFYSSRPFN